MGPLALLALGAKIYKWNRCMATIEERECKYNYTWWPPKFACANQKMHTDFFLELLMLRCFHFLGMWLYNKVLAKQHKPVFSHVSETNAVESEVTRQILPMIPFKSVKWIKGISYLPATGYSLNLRPIHSDKNILVWCVRVVK